MTRPSTAAPATAAELFHQGLTAHQHGQLQAAEAIYRQVLRQWPEHADSRHLLGVLAHQTGHSEDAIDHIRRAIDIAPSHAHYHYNLGLALFATGRTEAALQAFDAALRLRPDYPEVHYNRGNALKQQGRHADAADCYRRALRHRPNYVEAHNNLGSCLLHLGRADRAEASFRRAIRIAPDAAEPHNNLGLALRDQGQASAAIPCFQQALRLRPAFADAHANLAAALRADGRVREAVAPLRQSAALRPGDAAAHLALAAALNETDAAAEALTHYQAALRIDPEAWAARHGLAETLRQLGRLDEAEPLFQALLNERPDQAEPRNDLANVLHQQGRRDEAIDLYRRALKLKPDLAAAHVNLGNVLKDIRDHRGAEASYRAALALDPDNADAHLGLGTLLLRTGRLAEGWPELEWRFRCSWRFISFPDRDLGRPRWNGEALAGRTLLIHAEQGFGDSIHFCRYVPSIARRARVVLELPNALLRLAGTLDGVEAVVPFGEPLPAFDVHCPLLSLPLLAGTTLDSIPAAVPYLHASAEAVEGWRRRLDSLGDGLRVGLAWAGNPRYPNDRWRSMTLRHLAPLAGLRNVHFVSLQKGPAAAQAAAPPPGMTLHDWTGELTDFADTAALIGALDLVISTDTSVPHLAGALGKPVWLLSGFDACWRWLLDRDDSPWYPTLRQFRQPHFGDWTTPVEALRAALQARAQGDPE